MTQQITPAQGRLVSSDIATPYTACRPYLLHSVADAAASSFRFQAVIDWIEFSVSLPAASQPRHVRARMAEHWQLPYVEAETKDPSRTATSFTFKLQDPVGPLQFMKDVQLINQPGRGVLDGEAIQITGIEIALDVYSCLHDRFALVDVAEMMFTRQTIMPDAGIPSRICPPYSHPQKADAPVHAADLRKALENGWTINSGNKVADFTRRHYVKCNDTRDGVAYSDLPVDQFRARSEITLRGAALPFTTLDAWRTFRFQSLQKRYFSWRRAVEGFSSPLTDLYLQGNVRRLGRIEGRANPFRRKTAMGTRSDPVMRQHAKNALEVLTRQQGRR